MIRKIEAYFISEDTEEISTSDRLSFWGLYAGSAVIFIALSAALYL